MAKTASRGIFTSFQNPRYRWLFASNMTFMLAMQGQILVRSMITYELTQSAFYLGLVSFTVAIPMFLLSPFGGVMADRFERRRLIMCGRSILILAELSILSLFVTGNLEFWQLLCSSALMGCVIPLTMPAQTAIVVDVVGKQGLQNAMALSMGGMAATRILGPTLAGVIVAITSLAGAYTAGVILYIVALCCLFGVQHSQSHHGKVQKSVVNDLMEGFRYVTDNRLILSMLLFGIVPMFLALPFQSLLVVFSNEVWPVGPSGLGLMYAVGGAGSLFGALYVAGLGKTKPRLPRMMTSIICFGIALFAFGNSPWFLLALPMIFLADGFASVFNTLNNSSIQMMVPDEVRGRISSFMMMSFSVTPMGTLPMSMVADAYGVTTAVSLASVLVILVAIAFFIFCKPLRLLDPRLRENHQTLNS
jgi:MFS family permease